MLSRTRRYYGNAFHAIIVFQVILAAQLDSDVNDFRKEVARRMLLPPWNEYTQNIDVSWTPTHY